MNGRVHHAFIWPAIRFRHGKKNAHRRAGALRRNLEADGFTTVAFNVDHGVVTLTGHLSSDTFREKAVADAEKANGVKHVTNQIAVP